MTMSTETPSFEQRIESAITGAIASGEMGDDTTGMPGPWVLVAVNYDGEGQRGMSFLTSHQQPLDSTLGLLEIGRTVWQQEARNWVMGGGDE